MADNVLSFETRVDLGGLNSGLDAAEEKVGEFSQQLTTALNNQKIAASQLSDAYKAFGSAAAGGSQQATKALSEYVQKNEEANAAVKQLRASVDEQTESTQKLSIEQRRQYEEYIAQSKAAEAAAKAANAHQITDLQATSAITRELSSGSSIRAVENFISKTLGLGPAMQAIFPIAGAVAFGEIVVEMGKKLYDAFDLGGKRARQTADDIQAVDNEIRRTTDSLNVQIDKLQQEQAKLEHKPFNGIKLVLDEAAESADRLATSLEGVDKQEKKVIEEMAGSIPQRVLGLAGNTDTEQTILREHIKWIGQAKTNQDQLNESNSYGAVLQTRLNDLRQKQNDEVKEALSNGGVTPVNNYSSDIAATQELINKQQQENSEIKATIALNAQQQSTQKARDTAGSGKLESEEARKQLRDIESAFADMHTKLPEEALAFWSSYVSEFKEGSAASGAEYTHVIEQVNKFTDQFEKGLVRTQKIKAEMKAAAKATDATDSTPEIIRGNNAAAGMMRDVNQGAAQSQHEDTLGTIETAQTKSANANALSLVPNPEEQLQALRKFHQQAIEEDARFLQQEMQIYAGEPAKVNQLQKQLEETRRKGNVQWLNDTKNISMQVAQAEQQALNKMETEIANTFAKSLSGQETWAQASMKLYDNVAQSFILNLVKMGEQSLVALALHKSVASQKILHDAKSAAADSWDWASGWGGPIAGAIAAAASFAGVMAFDSFEQGGIVAGGHGMPVPIMAHAGERVLSAPQTQKFESMVNGKGGGAGNTTHLHYSPNVNAFDRTGFRSTLQAHASDIHEIVRQGVKAGSLKP